MGTLELMRIKDILTAVFYHTSEFLNTSKTHNDIKFCKEAKTVIVVDTWLNSLSKKQQDRFDRFIIPNFEHLTLEYLISAKNWSIAQKIENCCFFKKFIFT